MFPSSKSYPALPGFYKALFLYFEPLSTFGPAVTMLLMSGAASFYYDQIPSDLPTPPNSALEPQTKIILWQLANSYGVAGMLLSLAFRVARDTLSNDLAAQERMTGAILATLALGDIGHISASFFGLPKDVQVNLAAWNGMTHANITYSLFLFIVRMMWFLGVGRTNYYFNKREKAKKI